MTLVTLAMGRSVSTSRPHRTWPVSASTTIAPLALTPLGTPVTWSTGPVGRLGLEDATGVLTGADGLWMSAGWGPAAPAADEQAARLAARRGTTAGQASRRVRRRITPPRWRRRCREWRRERSRAPRLSRKCW